jgi:hypothetical protein
LYTKSILNKYCVRERKKLNEAADHLAEVSVNLKLLVKDCQENFPDTEITKNLTKGFNPKKIIETLPTSEFTAYSENKGEKLAFCLEKEKGKSKLIDINTLTFVAIHELAHIASTQVGHGDEFWNNFKFLLVRAKENNIYKPHIVEWKLLTILILIFNFYSFINFVFIFNSIYCFIFLHFY